MTVLLKCHVYVIFSYICGKVKNTTAADYDAGNDAGTVMMIFNSPITVEKHKNNTIATAKKKKNTYTYTVRSPQQCHNSTLSMRFQTKTITIYKKHYHKPCT